MLQVWCFISKGFSWYKIELPAQRWSGHFYSESKYHPAKHNMFNHKKYTNNQLKFSLMMGYLPSQVQLDTLSYMKPRFFTGIRSVMKKEWETFNQNRESINTVNWGKCQIGTYEHYSAPLGRIGCRHLGQRSHQPLCGATRTELWKSHQPDDGLYWKIFCRNETPQKESDMSAGIEHDMT